MIATAQIFFIFISQLLGYGVQPVQLQNHSSANGRRRRVSNSSPGVTISGRYGPTPSSTPASRRGVYTRAASISSRTTRGAPIRILPEIDMTLFLFPERTTIWSSPFPLCTMSSSPAALSGSMSTISPSVGVGIAPGGRGGAIWWSEFKACLTVLFRVDNPEQARVACTQAWLENMPCMTAIVRRLSPVPGEVKPIHMAHEAYTPITYNTSLRCLTRVWRTDRLIRQVALLLHNWRRLQDTYPEVLPDHARAILPVNYKWCYEYEEQRYSQVGLSSSLNCCCCCPEQSATSGKISQLSKYINQVTSSVELIGLRRCHSLPNFADASLTCLMSDGRVNIGSMRIKSRSLSDLKSMCGGDPMHSAAIVKTRVPTAPEDMEAVGALLSTLTASAGRENASERALSSLNGVFQTPEVVGARQRPVSPWSIRQWLCSEDINGGIVDEDVIGLRRCTSLPDFTKATLRCTPYYTGRAPIKSQSLGNLQICTRSEQHSTHPSVFVAVEKATILREKSVTEVITFAELDPSIQANASEDDILSRASSKCNTSRTDLAEVFIADMAYFDEMSHTSGSDTSDDVTSIWSDLPPEIPGANPNRNSDHACLSEGASARASDASDDARCIWPDVGLAYVQRALQFTESPLDGLQRGHGEHQSGFAALDDL